MTAPYKRSNVIPRAVKDMKDSSFLNRFQRLIRHIPVTHRYAAAELSRFVPDKTVIKYFLNE